MNRTTNGVTFITNSDGSIIINGTTTGTYTSHGLDKQYMRDYLIDGVRYYISQPSSSAIMMVVRYFKEDGSAFHSTTTFTWSKDYTFDNCYLQINNKDVTFNNFFVYPMIYISNKRDDSYEQYQEPTTHTINADGTVDITPTDSVTTLIPDTSGVMLDVEYAADTKKYIDNIKAEIQALILEG